MSHFGRIVTLLIVSAILPACAIKRQDVIECGLPDGSKFILRAKYDWHPISSFIPEAAERTSHTGFSTYYKAKNSQEEIGSLGASRHDDNYRDVGIAKRYCSPYGLINKVPYAALTRYKAPEKGDFTPIKFYGDVFLSPTQGGTPPAHIREALERFDAGYSGSAVIWHPNRLVVETAVVKRNSLPYSIIAVHRVESLDGGQTWVNPQITTEAEAFELGKTYDEQCFIARLTRIDDQKIEAHFPPCPISERLPK